MGGLLPVAFVFSKEEKAMGKYIVINGSFRPDTDSVSMVADVSSFEEAEKICQSNIAEDFGYNSWAVFCEHESPEFGASARDGEEVLFIKNSTFEHQEIYKIYKVS